MATSTLNINQEKMSPVLGQIMNELPASGVLAGQISPNQATPIVAGQYVKLDTTITGPVPQFLATAQGDNAIGFIPFQIRQASFSAGNRVEVALYGVVIMQATAVAIQPQTVIESDSTGLLVQAHTSNAPRGVSIDYVPANGFGRIRVSQGSVGAL